MADCSILIKIISNEILTFPQLNTLCTKEHIVFLLLIIYVFLSALCV